MITLLGSGAGAFLLAGCGSGPAETGLQNPAPTEQRVASTAPPSDDDDRAAIPNDATTAPTVAHPEIDWDPGKLYAPEGYLSVPDVVYSAARTDLVVEASTLAVQPRESFPSVGGSIEYRPVDVAVTDIAWIGPRRVGDDPLKKVEPGTIHVVDRLPGMLDEEAANQEGVLVGLAQIGPNSVDNYGADFVLSFVAVDDGANGIRFLGRQGPELTAQIKEIAELVAADRSIDQPRLATVAGIHRAVLEQDTDPQAREALHQYYSTVQESNRQPEVEWSALPVEQRALVPDEVPAEVADRLETIGVEFVLTGPRPETDSTIALQSKEGVALQMSTTIASNVMAVYRAVGETLRVELRDADGSRVEIGRIDGVPSGKVALVTLDFDGTNGPPTFELDGFRDPIDGEVRLARTLGYE